MAIGLRTVLEEDGIEVIGQESERGRIVRRAERLQPDVVVLDFDHEGASALASEIQRVAARTKVILWTRDETVMGVLESVVGHTASRGHHRTRRAPQRAEHRTPPRRTGGLKCPHT